MSYKESRELEVKEKYTKTCLKTIAAFATYGTGIIIFGVRDEDKKVVGVRKVEELKLTIENSIRDNIDPIPEYQFEEFTDKEYVLLKLIVFKGKHPPYLYRFKGYRRYDTSTAEVSRNEVKRMLRKSANITFEDIESFDEKESFQFKTLESFLKDKKEGFEKLTNDTLKTLGLINRNDEYNIAAELISDNPQTNYAALDIVRFGENISIFLERRTIEKESLLQQYLVGMEMFDKWFSPYEQVVGFDRVKRISFPREAYRESLMNALIHQDFEANGNIQISLWNDFITITSPGGLPEDMTKDKYLNGSISMPRNKIVANIFKEVGLIEKFGTGVYRVMKEYVQFDEFPKFNIDEGHVTVTLPRIVYDKEYREVLTFEELGLSMIEKAIIETLLSRSNITQREMAKIMNVSLSTIQRNIKKLIDKKLLIKHRDKTIGIEYRVNIKDDDIQFLY